LGPLVCVNHLKKVLKVTDYLRLISPM